MLVYFDSMLETVVDVPDRTDGMRSFSSATAVNFSDCARDLRNSGSVPVAPTMPSEKPNAVWSACSESGPSPKKKTVGSEIACPYAVMMGCSKSDNPATADALACATGRGGSIGVAMIFRYVPARHAPLASAPTASEFQLIRQFSLGVKCVTTAPPTPNPFCGAMLPTATCSGWSVRSSAAQPGTLVSWNMHVPRNRSASVRKSACSRPSFAGAPNTINAASAAMGNIVIASFATPCEPASFARGSFEARTAPSCVPRPPTSQPSGASATESDDAGDDLNAGCTPQPRPP